MDKNGRTGLLRFWTLMLVVLALLVSAAGSLSVVYLKQQIARASAEQRAFEDALAELHRKDGYLSTKLAQAHSPEFLKRHARTVLCAPQETQVVWGTLDTPEGGVQDIMPQPFAITFDLALLGK